MIVSADLVKADDKDYCAAVNTKHKAPFQIKKWKMVPNLNFNIGHANLALSIFLYNLIFLDVKQQNSEFRFLF